MKPSLKPRRQGEHAMQRALFEWADLMSRTTYPELALMFSIDHAGTRHISHARDLKARGVKAGIPDVCLPIAKGRWFSLWLELKTPEGHQSRAQRWWQDALEHWGHLYVIARSFSVATTVIESYLDPREDPAA